MKTALVTGATRGIGKAITLALLDAGYQVIGIYSQSAQKAKDLESEHNHLSFIRADLGSSDNIFRVAKEVQEKTGSLDVLVNNTGIEKYAKLEEYLAEDWDRMLSVNLTSVFLLTKALLPLLKQSESASIINVSSRLGMPERATSPYIVYGVTKAGVNMLTKGFADELTQYGIRVNAVFPTATKTDMIDYVIPRDVQAEMEKKGQLGKPEEVAEMVMEAINDTSKNGEFILDKRLES